MSGCACTFTQAEQKVIHSIATAISQGEDGLETMSVAEEDRLEALLDDAIDEFAGYEVEDKTVRDNMLMAIATNIANKTKEAI